MLAELGPCRIPRAEIRSGHPRVFRRVQPSAGCGHYLVQAIEQFESPPPVVGKVERQGGTGPGKRQQAWRAPLPEALEYGEERAGPGTRDTFQQFPQRGCARIAWNDALILKKTAGAVHPVPHENAV